jgi:hypothetical protein
VCADREQVGSHARADVQQPEEAAHASDVARIGAAPHAVVDQPLDVLITDHDQAHERLQIEQAPRNPVPLAVVLNQQLRTTAITQTRASASPRPTIFWPQHLETVTAAARTLCSSRGWNENLVILRASERAFWISFRSLYSNGWPPPFAKKDSVRAKYCIVRYHLSRPSVVSRKLTRLARLRDYRTHEAHATVSFLSDVQRVSATAATAAAAAARAHTRGRKHRQHR